jgi:hypothetical protein
LNACTRLREREVDVVEGVEETPEVENEDCAGGFPNGEEAGIEKKLIGELDDDPGLEAAEVSSFSFCIFRYIDLYDSKTPDVSAKGSFSMPLEIVLRRE